jgi:dienelactone hydrolase
MMLHGNGGNLQPPNLDILLNALQPASDQGWLIALPQSSQLHGKDRCVWDDIDWSVREVQHHLESLQKEYPVDTTRGIISGFSMGGGLALFMALTGVIPVYSVTVVAPWWGNIAELETAIASGKADHLQVSIIVSRHDVDCYRVSLAVETALKARGLPVTLIVTDDPDHNIPSGFRDLLATELQAAPRPV